MNHACVIVCERSGIWATALARHLPPGTRLRQTRGLEACVGLLAAAPASLLCLEATRGNLPGILTLMFEVGWTFPRCRTIVLAERGCEGYEWLLREAGAAHVSRSPRDGESLARLAVRHLDAVGAPQAGQAPSDAASLIWDALPWSDVA